VNIIQRNSGARSALGRCRGSVCDMKLAVISWSSRNPGS
jgi:hypothetical protein